MAYLKSTDMDERLAMEVMLEKALKHVGELQKQQAILIANQVGRLFKK